MTLDIIYVITGSILIIELVYCICRSKASSDYTWYLCRPFGIPFSMGVGAIIRLVCAVLGGIFLYKGIIGLL